VINDLRPASPESINTSVALKVTGLTVRYDEHVVLDDLSLVAKRGAIIGILGFSASGKTTLLRAIAGLTPVERGDIFIDGDSVKALPASKRRIGFTHQDFALFDDYSVLENISFGLRYNKNVPDPSGHVRRLIEALRLGCTESRYPSQLSGGMKQRVALARCLAPIPRLLLLDEPLSQLDPPLRARARQMMLRLFLEQGSTVLLVSHDIEDCMDLCDQIAILDDKSIVEVGPPSKLVNDPAHLTSAMLTGPLNLIRVDGLKSHNSLCEAQTLHGLTLKGTCSGSQKSGDQWFWAARPSALSLRARPNYLLLGDGQLLKKSEIDQTVTYQTLIKNTSTTLRVETIGNDIAETDAVQIYYDPERVKFYSGKESLYV
jgi:ABC-type Fe3+/spermidine/putrescine transport system ATPase subunit